MGLRQKFTRVEVTIARKVSGKGQRLVRRHRNLGIYTKHTTLSNYFLFIQYIV